MFKLFLVSCFCFFVSISCSEIECEIFLAPSLVAGVGRGVIAGKSFAKEHDLQISSSLTFPHDKLQNMQLSNYVYSIEGIEVYHSLGVFGISMIFNHRNETNVEQSYVSWLPSIKAQMLEAHASYAHLRYQTTKDIRAGEELFTSYGDEEWFSARGIKLNDSTSSSDTYDLEELSRVGVCLSHVTSNKSSLPMAGNGLFAKKDFKKGELVYVSPVLALPKHKVLDFNDESVLINFCIASPDSDVALMPIGLSAMANHGGKHTNMNLSWHFWPSEEPTVNLRKSADDLVKAPFAQLDLAYTATRDIRAGEELFIFYGEDWERKWWTHLRNLKEWLPDADGGEGMKPLFRHSIDAPAGLFPKWWKSYCVGNTCDDLRATADLNEDVEKMNKKTVLESALNFAKANFFISEVFPNT